MSEGRHLNEVIVLWHWLGEAGIFQGEVLSDTSTYLAKPIWVSSQSHSEPLFVQRTRRRKGEATGGNGCIKSSLEIFVMDS